MDLVARQRDGVTFVELLGGLERVDDALELVGACAEHDAVGVLVEPRALPAAFFDLSSRFAGEVLQKLQNYRVRMAAVIPSRPEHSDPFRSFLAESKHGRQFRTFDSRADAEVWLCDR